MAKKKVLITAIAVALICIVAVSGALAYLTAKSNDGEGITNTFVAAGDGKLIEDEEDGGSYNIIENTVTQKEDGTYEANSSTTDSGIEYKILPGQSLPKNASVKITGKTEVAAYLYLEVIDELKTPLSWTLDTDNWAEVKNEKGASVKGNNGGNLYVYVNKGTPVLLAKTKESADFDVNIIKDQKVSVASGATESDIDAVNGKKLSFYSYMAQASAGDTVAEVFANCFPASK